MTKALELAKFGRETVPTGLVVGDTDAQTLSSKTFADGPVFNSLNANGIPFLNASKVLSSSSTFVFDGTNIGLGVAAPASKFHIESASAESFRIGYSATKTARLGVTSTGDLQVYAYDSVAASYKNILLAVDTTASVGNVGIGTNSPLGKLHTNETNGVNYFESPGISSIGLQFRTNGVNRYRIGAPSASADLQFLAGGTTETMRLDTSGNLLVGTITNTNTSKLVVNGTISQTVGSTQYLVVDQSDIGTGANEIPLNQYLGALAYQDNVTLTTNDITGVLPVINGGTGIATLTAGYIPFGAGTGAFGSSASLFWDNTNARLAVGANSATSKLDVISLSGAYNGGIRLNGATNVNSTSGMYIVGAQAITHYNWLIGSQFNVSNAFEITPSTAVNGTTFNSPALVVLQNGNVGIGLTNPGSVLNVAGTDATITVTGASAGSYTAGLLLTRNSGNQSKIWNDGSTVNMKIATYAVPSVGNPLYGSIQFQSSPVTSGTLVTNMTLDAYGNLGVGSTGPLFKIQAYNGTSRTLIYAQSDLNFSGAYLGTATSTNRGASLELVTHADSVNAQGWRTAVASDLFGNGDLVWSNAPNSTTYAGLTYTQRMRLDTSGNLGLGITPSTWNGIYKVLQVGTSSISSSTSYVNATFGSNFFRNGANAATYISADYATAYDQDNGTHVWSYAASGAAGATFTFTQAMTLDASGRLGIGDTNPTAKLDVFTGQSTQLRVRGTNTRSSSSVLSAFQDDTNGGRGVWGSNAYANTQYSTVLSRYQSDHSGWAIIGNNFTSTYAANDALQFSYVNAAGTTSEYARFNDLGNFGLGITPNRWFSNRKALQFGGSVGAISMQNGYEIGLNFYVAETTATEKRVQSGYANKVTADAAVGDIVWSTAGTGAADSNITWSEKARITNAGQLLVGTTSPSVYPQAVTWQNAFSADGFCTDWNNVSSVAINLATLFPNLSLTTGSTVSVDLQIVTSSGSTAAVAQNILAIKRGDQNWYFSTYANLTQGGTTITASGSGSTITLTFGAGGQYGVARVKAVSH